MKSFSSKEKFIFQNKKGQTLELGVFSPFFLDEATGIEQVENENYTSKTYGSDGEIFISSTVQKRPMSFVGRIRLDKEFNRRKIISFFRPHDKYTIRYEKEEIVRFIDCYLEKTPSISKDFIPEFTINVICPNPYWYSEEERDDLAMWIGAFEFELEITEEGIEMGYRSPSFIVNVINDGDVDASMIIKFHALATLTNPHIINVDTQEIIKVDCELEKGDILKISTKHGDESVVLIRNNVEYNYFNHLTLDSNLKLKVNVGDNLIRYNADTGLDNLEVSIYHIPQFLGV